MIIREWKQINPCLETVKTETLRHFYTDGWRAKILYSARPLNQNAQNIKHNKEVIDDFVAYINKRIEYLDIPASYK